MSDRHITAVVLLSGATTAATHDALRTSLATQTRPAERTVVVAPSDLAEDVHDAVQADLSSGTIDEILPISASVSRAGAIRETLELLARGNSGEEAAATESGGAAHERAQPRRRRAREVDSAAVERERTQRAEELARIPLRLRGEHHRPGRRVGAVDGTAGESWLWFVVDGATPASMPSSTSWRSSRSPRTLPRWGPSVCGTRTPRRACRSRRRALTRSSTSA
ncbi:hypothetical protein H3H54_10770 [Brachybacterium sp. Z12]|uniref:hypothetical protein n=1 Tax=Brachybacterium sp. Z12 TaxID=2759167 RepID=UPI001863073F|nr:hypothetical protein [Brachybacterium sp. Z12]QNN81844.1 hypothetical protein H3H54_10770 [Brachybacterium sp. Z12]